MSKTKKNIDLTKLLKFEYKDWKKLLYTYYKVEVSEEFLRCADLALSKEFEDRTKLKMKDMQIRLDWGLPEKFIYEKGSISKMSSRLWLPHGHLLVTILWKSKSDRIYEISDTDIDCNDIEFWFEGLDVDFCIARTFVKWSLLPFPELDVEGFLMHNKLVITEAFLICADKQLSPMFEKATGLKINKHINLVWRFGSEFVYEKGETSRIPLLIYVNHNWNPIAILWKSKSGRIYEISDTDIDCNDIEFWFEGLNPVLYYKQMYPNDTLPFKLKSLSYKLEVQRLNMNCTLTLQLQDAEKENAETIAGKINEFIDGFNESSEKKNREDGVVHNWKYNIENDLIIYDIDTGFAGPSLFKKLLPFLSSLNCFKKAEIG